MKILVANIGSTSLKWRLFDFSNGTRAHAAQGRLRARDRLPEGDRGLPGAIEEGRRDRKMKMNSRPLASRRSWREGVNGCVRLDERVLKAMEALQRPRSRAQSALHHRHSTVR